jgi:hypothetical protein
MSDCGVCIGSDDYDNDFSFYDVLWPKARKEHRCCECRRVIGIGEQYQRWAGKWDGTVSSYKTCGYCAEIRDGFSCGNSTVFGDLWTEISDYIFPVMNTACFDKIESVEAKAYLQSKWMNWKFSDRRKQEENRKAKSMIERATKENM